MVSSGQAIVEQVQALNSINLSPWKAEDCHALPVWRSCLGHGVCDSTTNLLRHYSVALGIVWEKSHYGNWHQRDWCHWPTHVLMILVHWYSPVVTCRRLCPPAHGIWNWTKFCGLFSSSNLSCYRVVLSITGVFACQYLACLSFCQSRRFSTMYYICQLFLCIQLP